MLFFIRNYDLETEKNIRVFCKKCYYYQYNWVWVWIIIIIFISTPIVANISK